MPRLIETGRETYGHDARATNKHTDRRYRDENGRCYILSRTLDGIPPFFEAYGPFEEDHEGLLPRLMIANREYWGDGWSWRRAEQALCRELQAVIVRRAGGNADTTQQPTQGDL